MTTSMRSTPHSTALPASQTAPVAEFRCLFTHDVRRKQKRWQDGYLKFHTFNNRVMVTDQARNHIGDTYWKESNELQEGDELSLDKGVLVEVAEAVGITQTDLAPLLAKKKDPPKEPLSRTTPSVSTRPFQRPTSVAPSNVPRSGAQLRHKSLNTLLGTSKGPVGKAVPVKSPYETRMEKEQENNLAEERAPKRQKTAQRPTAWRASSPVHGDESSPVRPMPLYARAVDAKTPQAPHPAISRPTKVITISSEESDHIPLVSSNVTLPSTPAKVVKSVPTPPVISAPAIPPSVFVEPVSIPVETPKVSRPKISLPKKKPVETPKRPAPTSSPPVSASNRLTNVDFAVQPVQKPQKKPTPPSSPPRNPKAKSLRLSTGVKRGTLLCQTMSRPASRAGSEPRASASRPTNAKTSRIRSKELSPVIPEEYINEQRGNDLPPSRASLASGNRKPVHAERKAASKRAKSRTPTPPQLNEDVFDDPEVVHGLMDQQLLIPSSPVEPCQPQPAPVTKSPVPKPVTKRVIKEKSKAQRRETTDADAVEDEHLEPKPPASKRTTKKAQLPKKAIAEPQAAQSLSPSVQPVFKPPEPRSRDISPAHTDESGTRSRTNSTSPAKKPLSTGGFPKRAKRIAKEAAVATPAPEAPAPPPPHETVAPPPHPLRSGKKGPLMSTTELAALLTKPKKRIRTEDPIEDDAQPTTKSPARKIRRVRSENDAPIPSTAEDWEKRNLPKTSSNLTEAEDAPAPVLPVPKKKSSGLAALVKRTDPRKKFQRTQSLTVETNMVQVDEPDLPSPVIDNDVGPWSTEAFDLFDWRPPLREEAVT